MLRLFVVIITVLQWCRVEADSDGAMNKAGASGMMSDPGLSLCKIFNKRKRNGKLSYTGPLLLFLLGNPR